VFRILGVCFGMLVRLFRRRRNLFLENLALRQQLEARPQRHHRNDLVFLKLTVRDQEVGGSNPLAPTNYFAINNLRTREWSSRRMVLGQGGHRFKSTLPLSYRLTPQLFRALQRANLSRFVNQRLDVKRPRNYGTARSEQPGQGGDRVG
jgi:hypothetical protein